MELDGGDAWQRVFVLVGSIVLGGVLIIFLQAILVPFVLASRIASWCVEPAPYGANSASPGRRSTDASNHAVHRCDAPWQTASRRLVAGLRPGSQLRICAALFAYHADDRATSYTSSVRPARSAP